MFVTLQNEIATSAHNIMKTVLCYKVPLPQRPFLLTQINCKIGVDK